MAPDELPPDAETFLARLRALPDAAWDDILAQSRLGPRRVVRVLWRALRDLLAWPFRTSQTDAGRLAWSQAAIARVFQLKKAGAFPQRLGPRGLALVQMALQALCLRASLTPEQVARAYAPFDAVIPLSSLAPPKSGGA